MKHSHVEKPSWAHSHRQCDISDVWVEEVDTECEAGVAVTAHLSENTCGGLHLDGIEIEDIGVTLYYDRVEAATYLGMDAIYRIEDVETGAMIEEAASA